jgi:hypothetical protein
MTMLYGKLYSQLRAIEALAVVDKARPCLNQRGQRILNWLRRRYPGVNRN